MEYDKIIARLEEQASSQPGRDLCHRLKPTDTLAQIALRQQQTQDAVTRLLAAVDRVSFGNNKDFSPQLSRLSIGSCLRTDELVQMASFLENVARIKSFGRTTESKREEEAAPDSLSGFFEELVPLSNVSAEIRRCILSEEEIADDATPEIRQLRRKMASLNDRIHSHLTSMVNGSVRTSLMEGVITQKNGRYCLPVKAENKSSVPGIVHERSSTGSTLFIEPAAVVELNNQIRELSRQEEEEIEKLLSLLSASLSEQISALRRNCEVMTLLDFIFAKGSLALSMKAGRPDFSEKGQLQILQGRHPLLAPDRVVPIDIRLPEDVHQMIITGPNTGGKTVSLKTVGLFCLMAQAGLFIPAREHSVLPVFREVYADIGDEQSIEQNLSTFSSHMTVIVDILRHAQSDCLCLFDELCSGTDPDEGAALAISILEKLFQKKAMTMATTHYSELKLYALSKKGVVNACCEFDVSSLMPTYRLLIGIPGKSNAFAISSRLGLSDEVIDNARKRMSREQEEFEDIIADLEQKRRQMEESQLELSQQNGALQKRLEELEKRELTLTRQKEEILQKANEEARQILQNAKDVADETIRSFNKFSDNTPMREMEQKRSAIRSEIDARSKALGSRPKKDRQKGEVKASAGQIRTGDAVRVLSMNLKGTVATLPDHKGYLFVQCGIMRSRVHIDDLVLIPEDTITGPSIAHSSFGRIALSKSRDVSTQLNLLGKTTDEAIVELDKYLDDAYMAHIPMVRIVHGKGTGALRKAVHQHLKRQKHVKEYRLGEFGEGDAGVTIVTFR